MDDARAPDTDLAALTASLQSDTRDTAVFFRVLCTALQAALPNNTTVDREHSLLKSRRFARKVTVSLATETFEAELSAGRVVCRHIHAVSGVGGGLPYSREVSVAEWTEALVATVGQVAAAGSAATAALRSLST